jgi:hypothetical protein
MPGASHHHKDDVGEVNVMIWKKYILPKNWRKNRDFHSNYGRQNDHNIVFLETTAVFSAKCETNRKYTLPIALKPGTADLCIKNYFSNGRIRFHDP